MVRYNKRGNVIFNPIIAAFLMVVVIVVAIPVINMIKLNSEKIDTDAILNMDKPDDGFVPFDPDSAKFDSEEYKTSLGSTLTLAYTINLIENKEGIKELLSKPSDKTTTLINTKVIKDITGYASNVPGKANLDDICCEKSLKSLDGKSVFYLDKKTCSLGDNPTLISQCGCTYDNFNFENGPCFTCDEKDNTCTITQFNLPQDIESEGFVNGALDYVLANNDPKYIMYFESFSKGEESTWQPSDKRLFLLGIGVQVFFSVLLPGVGKATKLFSKLDDVRKLSGEIVNLQVQAAKTSASVDPTQIKNLKKQILTKLKKIKNEDEYFEALYYTYVADVYDSKSASLIVTNLANLQKQKSVLINIKPETLVAKIGIDPDDSVKVLEVLKKNNLLEGINANGNLNLLNFDFNTAEEVLLESGLIKYTKNSKVLQRLQEANKVEDFISTLSKDPKKFKEMFENFGANKRFIILKNKNYKLFEERLESASKKAEKYLGTMSDVNIQNMLDEKSLSAIFTYMDNPNAIATLDDLFSPKKLLSEGWDGFKKMMGAPGGDEKKYMEYLLKGGVGCPASIVGVVGLGTGAVATSVVYPPASVSLALSTITVAGSAANYCYKLTRTTMYPLLFMYYMLMDDEEEKNQKFIPNDDSNKLSLKVNSNYNYPSEIRDLKLDSKPLVLKVDHNDPPIKDVYFVSPCNVKLEIKDEYCMNYPISETLFLVEKGETNGVNFIPLKPKSSKKDEIKDLDVSVYYLWDDLTDYGKIIALKSGLESEFGKSFLGSMKDSVLLDFKNLFGDSGFRLRFAEVVLKDKKDVVYLVDNLFREKNINKVESCKNFVEIYSKDYSDSFNVDSGVISEVGNWIGEIFGGTVNLADGVDSSEEVNLRADFEKEIRNVVVGDDFLDDNPNLRRFAVYGEYNCINSEEEANICNDEYKFDSTLVNTYVDAKVLISKLFLTCDSDSNKVYDVLFDGFYKHYPDSFNKNVEVLVPDENTLLYSVVKFIKPMTYSSEIMTNIFKYKYQEKDPGAWSTFPFLFEDYGSVKSLSIDELYKSTTDLKKLYKETQVNFADKILREMYKTLTFIGEDVFTPHKDAFEKKVINYKTSDKNPPTQSILVDSNGGLKLHTSCMTVNVVDYINKPGTDNYCFAASDKGLEYTKEVLEVVGILGGIVSLGVSGGTSLGIILAAADLADIAVAIYLDYSQSYPRNSLASRYGSTPNQEYGDIYVGQGVSATK